MKPEKQEILLQMLRQARYRVDPIGGKILKYRKNKAAWLPVCEGTVNGYKQMIVWGPRNSGQKIVVYSHIAIYITVKGPYPQGMEVNHKDRIRSHNAFDNLELTTAKQNSHHSRRAKNWDNSDTPFKLIRNPEIKAIRAKLAEGKSQSAIARELGLRRHAVLYICNKIKNNIPLKYEEGSILIPKWEQYTNALKDKKLHGKAK